MQEPTDDGVALSWPPASSTDSAEQEVHRVPSSRLMAKALPGGPLLQVSVAMPGCTGGFLQEYCEGREATPYTDELGGELPPSKGPVVKPLLARPLEGVLDEWDIGFVQRVVAAGGMPALLALLSAAESTGCAWLFDVLTAYIAHLVRSTSPDAMREGLFAADVATAPTDQHRHARFVQSVTFSP